MSSGVVLVSYCVLIVLASLAGGLIPLLIRLTHQRMELAISFVSGVMLGVALLHLLPDAWVQRMVWLQGQDGGNAISRHVIDPILWWLLAGFLAMFFIERFFCFHHHDVPADEPRSDCRHDDRHRHGHELTWTGAAIGLSVHSIVAGVALAASVKAQAMCDSTNGGGLALAGVATFLAIALHKPFDSMTLGTLMAVGRRSYPLRHLINALFGLMVPVGVGLFFLGVGGRESPQLVSCALAFSAGTFLCISLSDLLPELQFHQHDRAKLSTALLLGLALAWAVGQVEV